MRFGIVLIAGHAEIGVLNRAFGPFILKAFPQSPHGGFVGQVQPFLRMEELGGFLNAAVVVADGVDEIEHILALCASGVGLEFQTDVGTEFADPHLFGDSRALKVWRLYWF